MILYLLVFIISIIFTLLLTPVARIIALRLGAVDMPSKRKIHKGRVPRFGGLSIFISFMAAVVFAITFANNFGIKISAKELSIIQGIMFGSAFITLLGLFDDIKNIPPVIKLIGQMIASGVAVYFGAQILFVSTPFNKIIMLGAWAMPLTIMWMVAITNAMNLIDGLDGLACGITMIAAAALFAVAVKMNQVDSAILLVALCGCALAFLKFNFFPASIFLGDSGSLFFGFMLACASVVGVLKSTLVFALIIPVAVLGIPIYDTATAIIRRAIAGKPIFEADKKHLHHRLLRAGFNQRQVVMIIYVACLILSLAALAATTLDNYPTLIFLSVFVVAGILALDFAKDILRNIAFRNGDSRK
jgi:UDP-GlcNAc:undecaprenyl-phosphate GlcNAc-1-phosphate transferase